MNRLGDTSAFVIPAGQLLLTRLGKTLKVIQCDALTSIKQKSISVRKVSVQKITLASIVTVQITFRSDVTYISEIHYMYCHTTTYST